LLKGFFYDKAGEDVREAFKDDTTRLREAGAEIVETRLPDSFKLVNAAHSVIMMAEAAAVHEETFKTRMIDYRPNIRGMIATGLLVPSTTYIKAQRIRGLFIREVSTVMRHVDCLLTPATPAPAPKGLKSTGDMSFNAPWSFCGFPSISVPSCLTEDGLPLGMQLVGLPFEEGKMLKVAQWCENGLDFKHLPPDLPGSPS
jgi:Asp-tRNA(Asn)/Glu-tRNA(Gln) amidotransferase A subunit family amidase